MRTIPLSGIGPSGTGRAHATGAMVSLAAWAVQVLYEAASAEKVELMLDSGLLPGLEYVRVRTPSNRVCAGVVGGAILLPSFPFCISRCALPCAVQRVGVGTGPFGCAAGEARRVARRRSESRARADAAVRAGRAHTHAHERSLSHTLAHTHTRARRQAGRQGKAVTITSTVRSARTHTRAPDGHAAFKHLRLRSRWRTPPPRRRWRSSSRSSRCARALRRTSPTAAALSGKAAKRESG